MSKINSCFICYTKFFKFSQSCATINIFQSYSPPTGAALPHCPPLPSLLPSSTRAQGCLDKSSLTALGSDPSTRQAASIHS